ncbi:phenoloxidase-activating factor 2-like [Drosophila rhopaloa]|uniref:Peptidase S1 domain-containing protein n=1 Tax=Drosophila rhopaloa TaxID=1041015 RepID=A0ABM5J945_DRORH|nr:phenoloxidase-activating factor 2-like [Drosophila rhopaloa]
MFLLKWTLLRHWAIGVFLLSCIIHCDACSSPYHCAANRLCLKVAKIGKNDLRTPCKANEICCEYSNITNERNSRPGQFPWTIALFSDGKFFGGGSLIAPRVVLTVAHSIRLKSEANIMVRAGEWDLASASEPFSHEDRYVAKIVRHKEFVQSTGANDIALLYLTSPFELKDHIQTICLPHQGKVFLQDRCLVAGWGKQSFEAPQFSQVQKKIDLPMVDRGQCQNLLRTRLGPTFELASSLICAGGEKDNDACTGDGGSALFCPLGVHDNRYLQAGIVNWGVECGKENVPAVFTSVAIFRDWIDQSLAVNSVEPLTNCALVGPRIVG